VKGAPGSLPTLPPFGLSADFTRDFDAVPTDDATHFAVLRNFHPTATAAELVVTTRDGAELAVPFSLGSRESFTTVHDFGIADGLWLVAATLPVVLLRPYADGKLMVVEAGGGELIFDGDVSMTAEPPIRKTPHTAAGRMLTRLSVAEAELSADGAMCMLESTCGRQNRLYVLVLTHDAALTLAVRPLGGYKTAHRSTTLAWGAYDVEFGASSLEVDVLEPSTVRVLNASARVPAGFAAVARPVPHFFKGMVEPTAAAVAARPPQLRGWRKAEFDWDAPVWQTVAHQEQGDAVAPSWEVGREVPPLCAG
jgi:hypothetical protein